MEKIRFRRENLRRQGGQTWVSVTVVVVVVVVAVAVAAAAAVT
jgi:hypothetical protein